MNDFRPGEIVDVTIEDIRVVSHPSERLVRVADESGHTYEMPPQAVIRRVYPAHWPPSPGEIWRDAHGSEWFAQKRASGEIRLIPAFLGDGDDPNIVELPEHLRKYRGPLVRVHGEDPPF